ncbi:DUF2508 family protein [Clostridium sp. AL.422]|uniref:DUF2508 family protein n=1 Tax=Clostridium TaxID=1485 RepID=UPI00293DB9DB|nr:MULTISPECIES: DUF2508 family protein [unclassified Clostridium]MDV4149551.1 DUF2508 family protein [Clostridium sp. AL.422]
MNKITILDLLFKNAKKKNYEYSIEDIAILKDIEEAIKEMEVARALFNSVSDPKLIELAIHEEDVARTRYEYLINMAKSKELRRIE